MRWMAPGIVNPDVADLRLREDGFPGPPVFSSLDGDLMIELRQLQDDLAEWREELRDTVSV
jgi:hypothetical protein